jgi:hypothetical protein
MLCPSCNTFRPANNGPCPQCNARSPLMGGQDGGFAQPSGSYWEGPMTPSSSGEWNNNVSPGSSQVHDNSLWAQVMAPQVAQGSANGQPPLNSILPVPYTGGQQPVPYTMGPGSAISTIQLGGAMIPAPPAADGPIYVPPMYTKPRAIIPRYRVISGLISFIVVIGLLCAGGIYYAKATGKLSFLHQIITPLHQNINPSPTVLLPTPTVNTIRGPASNIINSVATASTIDPNSGYPKNATNTFTVNQKIYLTYSVHSNIAGYVTVKWFTDGNIYFILKRAISQPQAKNGVNGNADEVFATPVEGMVEIYWNDQLAAQLYFVVEPASTSTPG